MTLTIDDEVLRAVRARGARTGKGDSEVIEAALRRELRLDLLDRLWQRNDLTDEAAVGPGGRSAARDTATRLSAAQSSTRMSSTRR